ncbi:TPA: DUF932 domain-containing protein [Escherichia coli]|nr:DUF932 domain-containing protein [Escherichia coli]KDA76324.1 antirestriction family protein [Escherichia coli 2-011-08_S3_C2]KDU65161.1 antirestriction family protein [Escherichia coli 4-203-08_S4_C3]KDW63506.1 antirestriction family protein [Escherichia coli 2-005-03_S4_C1]KDY74377.1 antirestriction family protein [Escherichia coli 2-474-04_S3_C1]KDY82010.1 antirestriction family protein [Escherichia coli 2-474-04_S3_C2]KDY98606.1 antirestriction family protein [Escherichia coli 2-474-04
MRLASRFGYANQIRRDRPLTHEELMRHVPSIFGENRHTSRSEHYAYIPTITVLENLQQEGFQPFFACQTRVRDQSRREYTKHMLRLRRAGQITGQHVPEIILLNSHDGSSSYQMLPGYFRAICTNGLVCGQSLGELRVPHRGNVVDRVIERAYEVVGVFDRILFNAMNGNRAEMSPEAAGIAACLMTYSHHACRTECYAMTVHYYRLRDYALQHPECSAIMRIID